jgi:hypothetical protein
MPRIDLRLHTRRRNRIVAAAVGLGMAAAIGSGAEAAQADVARTYGDHTICAESVHVFNSAGVVVDTLGYGANFYIIDYADQHVRVWGAAQNSSGWVYNGYFC